MNALKTICALLLMLAACDSSNPVGGHDAAPVNCEPGLADCNHDGICETDVTKPENCGGYGLACATGPNAEATCSHGVCAITCLEGFGDCDAMASNGCESDFTTPGTCGSCGNSCGGACVDGACASCDAPLAMDSNEPLDAAHALGLCGDSVVSAKWVRADGTAPPTEPVHAKDYDHGHGILPDFGAQVMPREGTRLLALSSGAARRPGDPDFQSPSGYAKDYFSAPPLGFPHPSPACPGVETGPVNDPIALELELKVPDWAYGFAFDFDFYTYEWPAFVCSRYNDLKQEMQNQGDEYSKELHTQVKKLKKDFQARSP